MISKGNTANVELYFRSVHIWANLMRITLGVRKNHKNRLSMLEMLSILTACNSFSRIRELIAHPKVFLSFSRNCESLQPSILICSLWFLSMFSTSSFRDRRVIHLESPLTPPLSQNVRRNSERGEERRARVMKRKKRRGRGREGRKERGKEKEKKREGKRKSKTKR